ncbi:hypothetical protein [Romboutsia sp.]|uniref:hypothetical protein n=1 Tax=Romboutsia sp. TaxID=1965302 RepID=UPI002B715B8C|nr:hypothetical protein [Romboutsia sp.]HSQ90332.1 hypothetical protein [Romboutsia sp.]
MKPMSNLEADKLLEELFSHGATFKDYEESFYNEKEYEEEEYIEPITERDLKGDI